MIEFDNNTSINKGVVYFAFGDIALKEANLSANSIRESDNPGIKSAIFTDLPDKANQDIIYEFNKQEIRDIDYHFVQTNRMPSLKVRFLMRTPFYKTLLLDADTFVKGNIDPMFDALDDHDLVLTNAADIEQKYVPNVERPVHSSLKSLTKKSAFSCAVFSYRKSQAMQNLLFEWWSQFVEKSSGETRMKGNWGNTGGINEQGILHQMMADGSFGRCDVKKTTLPNIKYNAGYTMWAKLRQEGLWDECSILHSHLIFQAMKTYEPKYSVDQLPDLPVSKSFL